MTVREAYERLRKEYGCEEFAARVERGEKVTPEEWKDYLAKDLLADIDSAIVAAASGH